MRLKKFLALTLSLALALQPAAIAAAQEEAAGIYIETDETGETATAAATEAVTTTEAVTENEAVTETETVTESGAAVETVEEPQEGTIETEEEILLDGSVVQEEAAGAAEQAEEAETEAETVTAEEEPDSDPAESADPGEMKDDEESGTGDVTGGITLEGVKITDGVPVITVGATVKAVLDGADYWESSDPAIATVSYSGGIVTALKAGVVSLNAYMDGGTLVGSMELVVAKKMSTFKLNKTSVEMVADESAYVGTLFSKSVILSPTINPAETKALVEGSIYYESSDPEVASVDETTGKVTAGVPGTAYITCYAGGRSITCDIVVFMPMEAIELYIAANDEFDGENDPRLTLAAGEKELLRVRYLPENVTETKKVTWTSSDKKTATVNDQGVVQGVKKGSCTITATWKSSDNKRTCSKQVAVVVTTPLEEIKIVNSKKKQVSLVYLNIKANGTKTTEQLSATLTPTGHSGSNKVEWGSSNEEVATVSSNGTVTPLKKGYTTITASCQDVESYCVVKVTQNLESLKLDNTNISLAMGQSLNLEEYVHPVPENCSDAWVLTWKSANKSIVNVEDGVITGVNAGGPVKVTVTCGKITTYFNVTVKRVTIGGLIVDETAFELQKGGAAKNVNVVAAPGAELSVSVDDENIVTVAKDDDSVGIYEISPTLNGSAGTAKVTFTATYTLQKYNGVGVTKTRSVKCIVKVVAPVEKVTIMDRQLEELTSLQLNYGDIVSLKTAFTPEDATDAETVTWKSTKASVASVDKNGVLKAKGAGDCQITATIGGKTAYLPVTVIRPLTDIKMNKTSVSLKKGGTAKLSVSFNPSNTNMSKALDWQSSDDTICTVSDEGLVRAVTGGTAVITATCKSDDSYSCSCVVNVTVPLKKISFSFSDSQQMYVDDSQTLTLQYDPEDTTYKLEDLQATLDEAAYIKALPKWTSGNTKVMVVEASDDGTCVITAIKAGTATVKVAYQGKSYSLKFTVLDH